jgi:hypothetical protein
MRLGASTIVASIANISTLEKLHSTKPRIITAISQDSIKKEAPAVARSNSISENSRLASMYETVKNVLKSLCENCGSKSKKRCNENSLNLCEDCNTLFCFDCVDACACVSCHRKLCEKHSIRCALCNLRSCKNELCSNSMKMCGSCSSYFCLQHLEEHKQFNQAEPYTLNCTTKSCKILFDIKSKGVKEFVSELFHARGLTEIKISQFLRQLIITYSRLKCLFSLQYYANLPSKSFI